MIGELRLRVLWRTLVLGPTLLGACRIHPGANHLLFVSKANSGLDVDSMPAGVEASVFGHSDSVLGPTFDNGQSVPVIASFQRSNDLSDGWPFAGSTVVTGPAAMAVAGGWVMATETGNPASVPPGLEVSGGISDVEVSGIPNAQDRSKQPYVPGDAPPTWFSMSEGFGLEFELNGPNQPMVESVHAGYRRKESLVVPLSMSQKTEDGGGVESQSKILIHTPSVLNVSRMVPVTDDGRPYRPPCSCHKKFRPRKLKQRRVQLFATGNAATLLSGKKSVQNAVLEGFADPKCDKSHDKGGP